MTRPARAGYGLLVKNCHGLRVWKRDRLREWTKHQRLRDQGARAPSRKASWLLLVSSLRIFNRGWCPGARPQRRTMEEPVSIRDVAGYGEVQRGDPERGSGATRGGCAGPEKKGGNWIARACNGRTVFSLAGSTFPLPTSNTAIVALRGSPP
jgi:hypothetical protein